MMKKIEKMMKRQREALEVKVQELKGVKGEKGFTLIELIVVMAILAILVLLAAPRFLGYTKDAAASSLQQDAKVLSDAAFQYNIEAEVWPDGVIDVEDAAIAAPTATHTVTIDGVASPAVALGEGEELIDAEYVKSVSGKYDDFYLIIDGAREGDVVSDKGTENKDSKLIHGSAVEGLIDVVTVTATP